MVAGTQRSKSIMVTVPWNFGGATPMTVRFWSLTRSVLPTIAGSPAKRVFQKPWEITTTGSLPGRSTSSARRKRPNAGSSPSTEK